LNFICVIVLIQIESVKTRHGREWQKTGSVLRCSNSVTEYVAVA